jgi:hypothetical protein
MRSFPLLKRLTLRIVAENRFESKDFRFCVNRLSSLGLCPDFGVPETYFRELTPAILQGLSRCPTCTDKIAQYLLAAPVSFGDLCEVGSYLSDDEKCIYSWQNYHLWSLLARKKHSETELLNRAVKTILSEDDSPTRAGATLYIGVLGDAKAKRQIAERFSGLSSFLGQRCALIALHELPYQAVKDGIQSHIRKDLLDVYRGLKRRPGCYYAPLERTPLTELIDLDSHYD